MLRPKQAVIAALFTIIVPLSAYADKVKITGGGFQFTHALVDPEAPDGFCVDPPGLRFSVTSDSFDGALVTGGAITPFTGAGEATGCAFLEPVYGVAAQFSGSFAWQTADGELRGTFELLDFPTDVEGVFEAVIFITFDGGTGKFNNAKGFAIAEGFDLPFGGLGGNPFAAGVVGTNIVGGLRLKE